MKLRFPEWQMEIQHPISPQRLHSNPCQSALVCIYTQSIYGCIKADCFNKIAFSRGSIKVSFLFADLPESLVSGGERGKYSVDLQGLCGLPPSDSATRPTDDGRKAKSATTNGRDRRKRSRNSSKSPKTRPESHQDRASSLTIKRKTKRRRRHTGNSPSITAEPGRERLREGEGELAVSVSPAPSVCSSHSLHQPARTKETSLEHHFNQLQIVSSHNTRTKSKFIFTPPPLSRLLFSLPPTLTPSPSDGHPSLAHLYSNPLQLPRPTMEQ